MKLNFSPVHEAKTADCSESNEFVHTFLVCFTMSQCFSTIYPCVAPGLLSIDTTKNRIKNQ